MRARGGTALLIAVVALGASCAGRSTGGGSEAGGAGGAGGTSTTGGNGAAPGAGGGGTSSGGTGTEDRCTLPPDSGGCDAAFQRFYFDAATGICEHFTYGGCDGNENKFDTETDCLLACLGHAENDVTRCSTSSECIVVDRDCCSSAPATRDTLIAVSSRFELDRCALVDCLPSQPVPGALRAWFGASCAEGRCRVVDARSEPITECAVNEDCTLRRGMACCESCDSDPANIVSVNLAKNFTALVCGPSAACDDCEVPEVPPGTVPLCASGRCDVGLDLRGDTPPP